MRIKTEGKKYKRMPQKGRIRGSIQGGLQGNILLEEGPSGIRWWCSGMAAIMRQDEFAVRTFPRSLPHTRIWRPMLLGVILSPFGPILHRSPSTHLPVYGRIRIPFKRVNPSRIRPFWRQVERLYGRDETVATDCRPVADGNGSELYFSPDIVHEPTFIKREMGPDDFMPAVNSTWTFDAVTLPVSIIKIRYTRRTCTRAGRAANVLNDSLHTLYPLPSQIQRVF
jgi:hypothetical protein